jgi:hypothetical protein
MQRAFAGVLIAPFITVAFMHLARGLKKDTSMSEGFVYNVRTIQDKFLTQNASFGRSSMQTMQPEPMFPAEKAREEAKNLGEMYSSIKETEKASQSEKVEEARQLN